MSGNDAREIFIRQRIKKVQKGKKDALAKNKPSEFSRAYINGYEEGLACRVAIIEQEWND